MDIWGIGYFGANRYMGQMGIKGMWGLGQMDICENGHFLTDENSSRD